MGEVSYHLWFNICCFALAVFLYYGLWWYRFQYFPVILITYVHFYNHRHAFLCFIYFLFFFLLLVNHTFIRTSKTWTTMKWKKRSPWMARNPRTMASRRRIWQSWRRSERTRDKTTWMWVYVIYIWDLLKSPVYTAYCQVSFGVCPSRQQKLMKDIVFPHWKGWDFSIILFSDSAVQLTQDLKGVKNRKIYYYSCEINIAYLSYTCLTSSSFFWKKKINILRIFWNILSRAALI